MKLIFHEDQGVDSSKVILRIGVSYREEGFIETIGTLRLPKEKWTILQAVMMGNTLRCSIELCFRDRDGVEAGRILMPEEEDK